MFIKHLLISRWILETKRIEQYAQRVKGKEKSLTPSGKNDMNNRNPCGLVQLNLLV